MLGTVLQLKIASQYHCQKGKKLQYIYKNNITDIDEPIISMPPNNQYPFHFSPPSVAQLGERPLRLAEVADLWHGHTKMVLCAQ